MASTLEAANLAVVRRILDQLVVRSSPLPRAPARDPTWEQTELGFVAA
jgi:hypothetical protein